MSSVAFEYPIFYTLPARADRMRSDPGLTGGKSGTSSLEGCEDGDCLLVLHRYSFAVLREHVDYYKYVAVVSSRPRKGGDIVGEVCPWELVLCFDRYQRLFVAAGSFIL